MISRFEVDFNEVIEPDLIMLSQTDARKDIAGVQVMLLETLAIEVQDQNLCPDGTQEILFAHGVVEANNTGQFTHVLPVRHCRVSRYNLGVMSASGPKAPFNW